MAASSVEEAEAKFGAIRRLHDTATHDANSAEAHATHLLSLLEFEESTREEIERAKESAAAERSEEIRLAGSLEEAERRLNAARAAEQEQRREQAKVDVADAGKAERAANKRIERGLASVRAGLEARAAAQLARRGVRHLVMELRDPEAEEEALRERYRNIRAELLRTVPLGMEVDEHSLNNRYESDLEALRREIAAEADAFAGEADATAFAEMRDTFEDLAPVLIDTATANDLRGGREFTQRPMAAGLMGSRTTGYVGRLYGAGAEFEEAERRYHAFNAALDRLVGQGLTLAQEAARRTASAGGRA